MKSSNNAATEMGGDRVKIRFEIERDAEGYPPYDSELLWARSIAAGQFVIDSIPFFVRGISPGDVVRVSEGDHEPHFAGVVASSNNSVIRVIVFNEIDRSSVCHRLEKLGCAWEGSNMAGLFSVNIPVAVDIKAVVHFLQQCEHEELLEYEEASMRGVSGLDGP